MQAKHIIISIIISTILLCTLLAVIYISLIENFQSLHSKIKNIDDFHNKKLIKLTKVLGQPTYKTYDYPFTFCHWQDKTCILILKFKNDICINVEFKYSL